MRPPMYFEAIQELRAKYELAQWYQGEALTEELKRRMAESLRLRLARARAEQDPKP